MSPLDRIPVEIHFKPAGKYWIGSCPSLDIVTQGETWARVQENLAEAIVLFFESCLQRGVLTEVLCQCGYTKPQVKTMEQAAKAYFETLSAHGEKAPCHA